MNKTVLIVNDSRAERAILTNMLRRPGLTFSEAESRAIMQEKLKGEAFDLIIIDHLMQGTDASELIDDILSLPVEKMAPALLTASECDARRMTELTAAGFQDFIFKPFRSEQLLQKVDKFLD